MIKYFLAALLLLSLDAALAADKSISQTKKREFVMEEIVREAGLDSRNPQSLAVERVSSLLRERGVKGIWLVSPGRLAIDQDFRVSILGFDFYDPAVRGSQYLSESGVVVATRVESRETFAALIDEPKPQSGPTEPADNSPMPSMSILRSFTIPLRDRLSNLPWRTGNYTVDVMLGQQMSNRARFQITAGVAAERDPAVAAFIEQQRIGASVPKDLRPAPEAGGELPNYRKTANSLPLPADIGIELAAERVSVFRPGAKSVLRGSYRLPVPSAFYRGGSGDGVSSTATVPITLVIVGNIMPGPFVAPLMVASYDRVERSALESVVTGHFEIDLFALPETSKVPQTYSIWAYSGDVRSAPATAAVVSPEMLK